MKSILKNRLALSTVVTTLIILVVSVLLAGVVTYFAINVTSTRAQEESINISKQHLWVTSGGDAEAAMMITNTGGRDVVLDKITIRGQEIAWASVFSLIAADGDPVTTDLAYEATLTNNTDIDYTNNLAIASTDLVLPSGSTMVVYITAPSSITVNDIGLTISMTVFTSQAMYYKETNVQADLS
jgi:uncharacterized membrane protein